MKNNWEMVDFIEGKSEHDLFQSINAEFTDIAGFPIKYYIKTNLDASDPLYGETTNSTFSETGYETKVVYEPTEETNMMDILGFQSEDSIEFAMMPKWIFTRDVAIPYGTPTLKPVAGDIIVTLWNNRKYEITNAGSEQSIFQGKKLIWEFTLTPFRFSEDSDSAETILDIDPNDSLFPDMNDPGFENEPLSAYGDNDWIENASDDIEDYDDEDTDYYGY